MWAEFSHETACETVKYAVVLNESYQQQSSSGEGFGYHSSAMLLSRTEDHIGVTASPVRGSPFEEVNRLEVVGGEGAMSLITADRNSLVGSKG